jgi:hypothetical protein
MAASRAEGISGRLFASSLVGGRLSGSRQRSKGHVFECRSGKSLQETIFRSTQRNRLAAKPFSALEESTLPQSAGKPMPIESEHRVIAQTPGEGSLPPTDRKEGNSR